jgi:hypothetical protein
VDAQLEDQKTNGTGDGAAMYAQASLVAELDAGPMHATSELDARGNEINVGMIILRKVYSVVLGLS